MDDHRIHTTSSNRTVYFWELLPHPKSPGLREPFLQVNFPYPGCISGGIGGDFSRIDLTYFGTYPLPEEWLKEPLSETGFHNIRPDKLQHAARAIFVLPDDMSWATVYNRHDERLLDERLLGLRGLSISPTGSLTEVRAQPNGSIRLSVTTASPNLFE